MPGTFELKKSPSGKFMFNLKAGNNHVILTSQPYASKAAAENGIESVRKNCMDDACFDRKKSKSGQPYFSLKSTNGQNISKSEIYFGTSAMENGIKSVKKNGASAKVKDNT